MEIRTSTRLAPAWAMILLLAVWAVFGAVLLTDDTLSPGLPVLAVLGYMMVCGLVNRRYAVVSPGRLEAGVRPLPGAGKPSVATATEVARWYTRLVIVPSRYGSTRFHAAGVELHDGRCVDVLGPHTTEKRPSTRPLRQQPCSAGDRRFRW